MSVGSNKKHVTFCHVGGVLERELEDRRRTFDLHYCTVRAVYGAERASRRKYGEIWLFLASSPGLVGMIFAYYFQIGSGRYTRFALGVSFSKYLYASHHNQASQMKTFFASRRGRRFLATFSIEMATWICIYPVASCSAGPLSPPQLALAFFLPFLPHVRKTPRCVIIVRVLRSCSW